MIRLFRNVNAFLAGLLAVVLLASCLDAGGQEEKSEAEKHEEEVKELVARIEAIEAEKRRQAEEDAEYAKELIEQIQQQMEEEPPQEEEPAEEEPPEEEPET